TEKSIADFLKIQKPNGKFYQLSKKLICPDMRITTLSDVYAAITSDSGQEVILSDELLVTARKPIDEMIKLGG
ncbi:MAG: quinolinate synthase NadA, partial [Oscillospiraceae bacterium]